MLVAVHLPGSVTVPMAVAVGVWVMWYWQRLGRDEVPESRRRIRRASIIVMLAGLPLFVRALSFVDSHADSRAYVIAWLLVLLAVGAVMVVAGLDVVNNLRIHRREIADAATGRAGAAGAARRADSARSVEGGAP